MSLLDQPVPAKPRGPAQRPHSDTSGRTFVEPVPSAMRALPSLTAVPIASIAMLLVLSIVAPAHMSALSIPIAVVGTLLGIPHGAADHVVSRWIGPRQRGTRSARADAVKRASFVAAYAAIAGVALISLIVAPTPTLVAFLVLSAAHFGRGELVTSAQRAGRGMTRATTDWPVSLAYGLVVVGLLLWARPSETNPLLGPLSPWLADAAARSRLAGLGAVAIMVAAAVVILVRGRRHIEAAELTLLAATFAIAPPLAAFGVYFGAWHALRHTGRLLDLAKGRQQDAGGTWRSAGILLARTTWLPSAVAVTVIAVLWLARDLASLQAEVSVLLAVTFPHAAVVWALDRRQSSVSTELRPVSAE